MIMKKPLARKFIPCKGRMNAVPPLFITLSEQHLCVSQWFCNVNLTSSLTMLINKHKTMSFSQFGEAVQKLPSTYLFSGIPFSRRISFSVKSICVLLFLTTFICYFLFSYDTFRFLICQVNYSLLTHSPQATPQIIGVGLKKITIILHYPHHLQSLLQHRIRKKLPQILLQQYIIK